MNDKEKESQQELFEEFSTTPQRPARFPQVSRTQKPILFSTNTEQMLMASILFILALSAVFFLGVMRGKTLEPAPAPPSRPHQPEAAPAPAPLPAPAKKNAAARPETPQAVPAEIPSKPYAIQLVTHRKKELAEAEMNALRAQGFYSFLIPSGQYYQVCVGQYASKEEAKKDLGRFSAKFKDCFLRRR